jgi:hypothetical protein
MTITVRFVPKDIGSAILAEAAIEFHEDCGPLAGFEITDVAVWRGNEEGKKFVTFPSRSYIDKTGKKRFFAYLRLRKDPAIPDSQKWALGNWIIKQYEERYEKESF